MLFRSQEKFPTKAVEITILFGGTAKTIGEVIADGLSKELKQPVVGVSRLGAGGATGYQYIQSRPATGYEIVFNSNSSSIGICNAALPLPSSTHCHQYTVCTPSQPLINASLLLISAISSTVLM